MSHRLNDENKVSDDSVFEAVKNTISIKTNLIDNFNLEEFNKAQDKHAYFVDKVEEVGFNNELYFDIAFYSDLTLTSYQNKPLYISPSDFEILKKSNNELVVLTNYDYYDNQSCLILGNNYRGLISLYYIKNDVLFSLLTTTIKDSFSILYDSVGNILVKPNEQLNYSTIDFNNIKNGQKFKFNNKNYIAFVSEGNGTSLFNKKTFYLNAISYDELFISINILEGVCLSLVALVIVVNAIILYLRVRKLTKPVNNLSNELSSIDLNKIQEKDLTMRDVKNEIDILENSYIKMLQRMQSLLDKQKEDNETQRKLELDALQAQINPHFLYNALDTIAWMAKIDNEKNIENYVIALARFYRLSLHKGAKYILVTEEVDIIKYFLEIQLKRYPDLFTYEIEMDEGLNKYKTLKLILQPFVENIIKYAFVDSNIGKIKVTIKNLKESIKFIIEDNGVGFDTEIIKNEELNSNKKQNGFGIYNVIERLRLEYGDKFNYQIESKLGKGTKVIIVIPKCE